MDVQVSPTSYAHRAAMPQAVHAFEAFIADADFPCVGAKSALAHEQLHYFVGGDIESADDDPAIARQWQQFAARADGDSLFVSLVAMFPASSELSEAGFERALWARLQSIHAIDRERHDWDATVSADPASPYFSMSVGGKAFYVVGLHPASSRPARRFACPALVFNLHSQFEKLRADERYEKLRAAITARDIALCGSKNPMLAAHGASSEARQYSGRQVGAQWVCPFHADAAAATPATSEATFSPSTYSGSLVETPLHDS